MVGVTGTDGSGPSNLMLSGTSWGLVRQVVLAKDIEGVSGKFGEGTSARLRRMQAAFGCCEARWPGIRKILARVVENPFSRSVHVAHLAHNSIRFNLGIDDELHVREGGRSLEEILEEERPLASSSAHKRAAEGLGPSNGSVKSTSTQYCLHLNTASSNVHVQGGSARPLTSGCRRPLSNASLRSTPDGVTSRRFTNSSKRTSDSPRRNVRCTFKKQGRSNPTGSTTCATSNTASSAMGPSSILVSKCGAFPSTWSKRINSNARGARHATLAACLGLRPRLRPQTAL